MASYWSEHAASEEVASDCKLIITYCLTKPFSKDGITYKANHGKQKIDPNMQHLDTKPSSQKVVSDCKFILLDRKQTTASKFDQIPRKCGHKAKNGQQIWTNYRKMCWSASSTSMYYSVIFHEISLSIARWKYWYNTNPYIMIILFSIKLKTNIFCGEMDVSIPQAWDLVRILVYQF